MTTLAAAPLANRPGLAGAVARRGPVPRCPADGAVLDGGPVVFWCPACRRGVQAADLDTDYHPPARRATP